MGRGGEGKRGITWKPALATRGNDASTSRDIPILTMPIDYVSFLFRVSSLLPSFFLLPSSFLLPPPFSFHRSASFVCDVVSGCG